MITIEVTGSKVKIDCESDPVSRDLTVRVLKSIAYGRNLNSNLGPWSCVDVEDVDENTRRYSYILRRRRYWIVKQSGSEYDAFGPYPTYDCAFQNLKSNLPGMILCMGKTFDAVTPDAARRKWVCVQSQTALELMLGRVGGCLG